MVATDMLSATSASPWLFIPSRDAATMVEITSAIRPQPSTRGRVLQLSKATTFSSASRASDSQASMASATWRARVEPLAFDFLIEESEGGALGGALGLGPLSGASPPNETRLLAGGGLASSGGG